MTGPAGMTTTAETTTQDKKNTTKRETTTLRRWPHLPPIPTKSGRISPLSKATRAVVVGYARHPNLHSKIWWGLGNISQLRRQQLARYFSRALPISGLFPGLELSFLKCRLTRSKYRAMGRLPTAV